MTVAVRPGEECDVPALTEIYNHYVRTSLVTFDDVPFTPEQRLGWFSHYAPAGPHRLFVAEDDTGLLGYATSSQHRPKPGYRTSVETTVCCAPGAAGGGVGTALYSRLFGALADEPLHRAYAGVAVPNDASRALHLRSASPRSGRSARSDASWTSGWTWSGSRSRSDAAKR